MCLIVLAYAVHDSYPLLLSANRDEYYERPTRPAHFWQDHPTLLAGRDCQAGGTWLGATRGGRVAAITNFRDMENGASPMQHSRGELPVNFLLGDKTPQEFLCQLQSVAHQYAGFNLLVGTGKQLWYYSNRGPEPKQLDPGYYGLSNHLLDTPWPKLTKGKDNLREVVRNNPSTDALLATIAQREPLIDEAEATEIESLLSAQFIASDLYGTRATTAVLINSGGILTFTEQNYEPKGLAAGRESFSFRIADGESR